MSPPPLPPLPRGGNRNVESYSQLREAAKQIIARVAGRLSGTVGRSGLMDPAVTGLERAAVVANTPITFRPRELLGVSYRGIQTNYFYSRLWWISYRFFGFIEMRNFRMCRISDTSKYRNFVIRLIDISICCLEKIYISKYRTFDISYGTRFCSLSPGWHPRVPSVLILNETRLMYSIDFRVRVE